MIYLKLLQNMALIALSAYMYNHSSVLKQLIKDELGTVDKILLVIFFSTLGILSNYTGVNVEPANNISSETMALGYLGMHDAIANTRPIAAIVSGYIGGPLIGVIVGLISGVHRYALGGFTAVACTIATIVEGLIGGIARKYSKDESLNVKHAFFAAIVAECFQMIIILIFARPLISALILVKIIAVPMILINSLGTVIFISIIKSVKEEYNKVGAIEAQKALNIAKRTVKYMRKGLGEETAKNISKIIYEVANIDGILIGDKSDILTCSVKNINKIKLRESIYKCDKFPVYKIINEGQMFFVCAPFNIPNSGFQGVLGLGLKSKKNINNYFIQFVQELSDLLSNQIELYKLNKLAEEASIAEFKALRSQIQPHFLFNALNTISSFCRTNPSKARELIIDLSNYFRQTLKREEDFAYLKDELEFTKSYISIEEARFGNRLKLIIDIPDKMMTAKVPAFILQPIVENAIKHGILPKPEGGSVYLKASFKDKDILFSVEDTGVGMSNERLNEILTKWPGIGLKNVNERLKLLYGEDHGLSIKTSLNNGTKISFLISMKEVSSVNG
ncbi:MULTISPECIES: LytS/YhcK type 5TM receptor domain-containing protein [Clostridium]|uniref:Predicted two-component sensor histidine kinase n=2 Tax=Clostridium TaxID=1485 RepID=D8GTU6_CLOLD|nr:MULTISPECIES: LytS/YhcK type 5TM receptor domain-containing protein [Clostridium]ADK16759.1 predicted two-component sensor histidine kinase [Clostridium ljungdahlii DSM 13528]OAA85701.1 Sensor histidine kinase YehU [Clostridium ljungdahlii DSM 13528]OAA93485.1 Sensor histidine kinase YehU [Clostridium coskatii]OBR96274.1 sensor histidine kinase YehU [Clostridium coskatii]